MRSKQYFSRTKNNPHEKSTEPLFCLSPSAYPNPEIKVQQNEKKLKYLIQSLKAVSLHPKFNKESL